MKRLRKALPVLVAIIATWSITTATSAQSSIPNGVFVRDSEGVVWLVLDGQRVNLAIWNASDADIVALPRSDRWAIMDAGGGIVAGDRPQWSIPPLALRTHVVQEGDTLNRIAQQYGVSPEAILQANGITDRNRVFRIGERLTIP